ncbi:MAG: TIGR04282 family arsenosugar biosynthesis glycosyltransferase [Actinomycetales bacterium]
MPDVVLPCLDEALALPALFDAMPTRWRPILCDNGSRDGSADIARRRGVQVVEVPRRGYGAAVHAGLQASDADVLAVMDADGTLDPRQLDRVAAPVEAFEADLVVGRRRPVNWRNHPLTARTVNAVLTRRVRRGAGVHLHDLGPMRAARRESLLALGVQDRRFGYPLEELMRAGRATWRVREVDVDYGSRAAGSTSKVTGSVRGSLRALHDLGGVAARAAGPAHPQPTVVVMSKVPAPGKVKTRLCPPLAPESAATLAEAALLDTLDAVSATAGVRRILALAGECAEAEPWKRCDFTLVPQRGQGLGDRLANVLTDVHDPDGGPVLLVGMDTPQLRPAHLFAALEVLTRKPVVLADADDGGWWLIGLRDSRTAEVLRGVPMSRPDTADLTRQAFAAREVEVAALMTLTDVDTIDDAILVAAQAPASRFAHAVREALA